jgi:hypothetical protein
MRYISATIGSLLLVSCSNPPAQRAEKPAEPAQPSVKITQFYASPPHIGKGERAQVCYGVEGAAKVQLDPAVESVWPALSRCVEVRPNENVTYTLTAFDSAGHSVTARATLEVSAARARNDGSSGAGLRMIQQVTADKLQLNPGEQVTICFSVRNATSVTINPRPGVQPSAERGCATDKPAKTTTYEVLAKSQSGQTDAERVTVKVR